MKTKYLIIILIITLAISGIVIFIIDFNHDAKKTTQTMQIIKKTSVKLDSNITEYNINRDDLAKKTSTYYKDNFVNDYKNILEILNNQEQTIKNTTKNVKILDKNCQNNIFNDSSINNICNTYKLTYEQIINVYVNDIENFNNLVDTYNNETKLNLKKFTSSNVDKYIDYNKDGKYEDKK